MCAILARDLLRDLVIGGGVAADHLHVDRRGQAEIQNLVGDIGRLEEEHHVGKRLAFRRLRSRSV